MNTDGYMELRGLVFKAYHGCLERERIEGNTFTVDFKGRLDIAAAAASDNLDDAVNYGLVYDVIAREMSIPSNLLENVAARIITALEKDFPSFRGMSVKVSKKNPPVNGECEWSSITLTSGNL